jgi:DNA-binding GntR family transcriptional regulator
MQNIEKVENLRVIEKISIERNLQNRVYEIIKNYLIRPDVPPGTRLYEEKFAREIGVSRTPVKAALHQLEQEGLVRVNYNKGAFKVHFSFKEVIEIVKTREALECLSLEMVTDIDKNLIEDLAECIPDISLFKQAEDTVRYPQFDQQFHEKLIKVAKTNWLYRTIKGQDSAFHMLRFLGLQDIERVRHSIEEHKNMVKALKANDIALTTKYTHEHFKEALNSLEAKHKAVPGLFL